MSKVFKLNKIDTIDTLEGVPHKRREGEKKKKRIDVTIDKVEN